MTQPTARIIVADVMDGLRQLPDESVHCVVTSPPYWGLRDYGVPGQIGLEPTPDEYVARIVEVFREVRRVLRHDGTLWLNLGDCYASQPSWGRGGGGTLEGRKQDAVPGPLRHVHGLKPKDLVGIPWRVAFALQADGWWLRSDIIWSKPNAMPESVTDRPARAHEYVFLLAKSERYYYDAEAIREPLASTPDEYLRAGRSVRENHAFGSVAGRPLGAKSFSTVPSGRNKRSVWTIATEPFPEAHFATFPQKLVEPMILAGSPERACPKCGAPWRRRVAVRSYSTPAHQRHGRPSHMGRPPQQSGWFWRPAERSDFGFEPGCSCSGNDGSARGVVLDPLVGSGTTLVVAARLGRDSLGIELNPEYADIARRRVERELAQLRIPLGAVSS